MECEKTTQIPPIGNSYAAKPSLLAFPLPARRLPVHHSATLARATGRTQITVLSLVVVLCLQALDASHLDVLDKGVQLGEHKQ